MRFDEVSARYGEFGTFFVGNILPDEKSREIFTHINGEKERNSFLFYSSLYLSSKIPFFCTFEEKPTFFKFIVKL